MTYRKSPSLMLAQAMEMLEEADRLQRRFFQLSPQPSRGPIWEPPADIFETPTHLSVIVALPGVAPDRVEVVIDGATLRVVGERPIPAPASTHIRRIEIPYGRFERRIELPSGQFEIQESSLANGCLVLTLRKL